jgi:hypothetical protein
VNFFERQDLARRQSRRLVILFALAVLAIVASVDFVLMLAFGGFSTEDGASPVGALVLSTLITVGIIGCASLFRTASLRSR